MRIQKTIFKLVLCILTLISAGAASGSYVAVLETLTDGEESPITLSERRFITDKLRSCAKEILPYNEYTIMTRDNINVMLDPSKSIEDCEGECLVSTGRNIGAHYIAQARVGRFGSRYTLTVELYDTKGGSLVDSYTAACEDTESLLDEIESNSEKFFGAILNLAQPEVPSFIESEPYVEKTVSEPEPVKEIEVYRPVQPQKEEPETLKEAIPAQPEKVESNIHWVPVILSGLALAGGVTLAIVENNEAKTLSEKDDPSSEKEYRSNLDNIKTAQTLRAVGLGVAIAGGVGLVFSFAF